MNESELIDELLETQAELHSVLGQIRPHWLPNGSGQPPIELLDRSDELYHKLAEIKVRIEVRRSQIRSGLSG